MAREPQIHRVFLMLGSNIAPETNLPAAVAALSEHGRLLAVSQVWQTRPIGFSDQSDFLNAAVLMETPLSAERFKDEVASRIEEALHRRRDPAQRFGPRTIDIDLMLFNREVLRFGRHAIPDPEILERPFVAHLLAELDPDYVHPEDGRRLAQIAAQLPLPPDSMQPRPDVVLIPPHRSGGVEGHPSS